MRERFGFRGWWPGETKDEIIIGAILTQQASWSNAEKAIANLKDGNCLDLRRISAMDVKRLEKLVRPSGFYRQKARRLKGLAFHIFSNYSDLDEMLGKETAELRKELLSLEGIGPETADSILLYAAGKRTFVIDAYTKRIMSRIYGTDPEMDYDNLKTLITDNIKDTLSLYSDFHAQFVELGKRNCRIKPVCSNCPASTICKYNNKMNAK